MVIAQMDSFCFTIYTFNPCAFCSWCLQHHALTSIPHARKQFVALSWEFQKRFDTRTLSSFNLVCENSAPIVWVSLDDVFFFFFVHVWEPASKDSWIVLWAHTKARSGQYQDVFSSWWLLPQKYLSLSLCSMHFAQFHWGGKFVFDARRVRHLLAYPTWTLDPSVSWNIWCMKGTVVTIWSFLVFSVDLWLSWNNVGKWRPNALRIFAWGCWHPGAGKKVDCFWYC